MYTLHLIPNAHLDPVWLWDWREGLNEGITTCRTILDLMDEFAELTFVRAEAAVYQHINAMTQPRSAASCDRWRQAGKTLSAARSFAPTPTCQPPKRRGRLAAGAVSRSFGGRPSCAVLWRWFWLVFYDESGEVRTHARPATSLLKQPTFRARRFTGP